jgi:hypothetical protein
MNKKNYTIGGLIVIFLICMEAVFVTKSENKKEATEITTTEQKTAKEVKYVYDRLTIGKGFEEVNKTLGSPLYTESTTDDSGNSETVYTWGSSKKGELGAKLTVGAKDNNIVEKALSGLYVPYEKEKVVSAEKFEKIPMNQGLSVENAINQFGEPNGISEYINVEGETV